jgi:hypothetical protein
MSKAQFLQMKELPFLVQAEFTRLQPSTDAKPSRPPKYVCACVVGRGFSRLVRCPTIFRGQHWRGAGADGDIVRSSCGASGGATRRDGRNHVVGGAKLFGYVWLAARAGVWRVGVRAKGLT